MVFNLELYASRLTGNDNTTQKLCLNPDLAIFANDYAFRIPSIKVLFIALYDVHVFLVCDQAIFAFVSNTYAGSYFVTNACET